MSRGNVFMAFILALSFGVVSAGGAAAAPMYHDRYGGASLEVDVGLFYSDLEPYGQWVEYPDYGWVFAPRVSHDWRPYTNGHWVWTDEYGWLWVSDEEFGWATCHYGRWLPDPSYGWVWVPGYEWGPAWVSWRSGGGYIGWAPLPPRVAWDASIGFRVGGAEIDAFIAPRQYVFVEERSFVDPSVRRHFVRPDRNEVIISQTRNVTRYRADGGRVVNRSVEPEQIERVTRHRVPRARPVEVDSVKVAHHARVKGDEVPVFRPQVRPKAEAKPAHGKLAAGAQGGPVRRDDTGRPLVGSQREDRQRRDREQQQARQHESEQRQQQRLEKQRDNQRREAEQRDARLRENQQREQQRIDRQRDDERRQAEKQEARRRQDQERQEQRLEQQRAADQRAADQRLQRERQQHEQQRKELDRQQARQRDELEKQHQREIKRPPREVPPQELERRHAEQHRLMDERQQRERRQVEAQQQQARQEREQQQRSAQNRAEKQQQRKEKSKEKPKDKPEQR